MIRLSALPTFQLPSVRNLLSIRSPNIIVFPPPRIRGIKKVVTDGMNTIVMPLITPGRLSGAVTRTNLFQALQPRSCAASPSCGSSLLSDV